MRRAWLTGCAIGLAALAIGCSDTDGSNPPPPPSPSGPGTIDGTYNGVTQVIIGTQMNCGSSDNLRLRVRNNSFHYTINQPDIPWRPTVELDVRIGQDGAFHAQSGKAYIDGTLSEGHMEGKIVGDSCGFRFIADSTGTV